MLEVSPSRLRVVLDRSDSRSHHESLLRFGDLREGRIVVRAAPSYHSSEDIARAILEGLGKDLERRADGLGASTQLWRRAIVWLAAERIREILVIRAQWLRERDVVRLSGIAAQVDADLTLVVAGSALQAWQEELFAAWGFERLTFASWKRRHRARLAEQAPDRALTAGVFPEVPEHDFTLFRATCRELLSQSGFACVDRAWRLGRDSTHAFAASHCELTQDAIAEHLRTILRDAGSLSEVVCRLRGAQVAFFHSGWLVRVSDERLAVVSECEPYDLVSEGTAGLLRSFVSARFGAAAALALITRREPGALVQMEVGDVTPDGRVVCVEGEQYEVPPAFAPLLIAARLLRRAAGSQEDEPLFVSQRKSDSEETGVRMTAYGMRRTLRTVMRETGLLVPGASSTKRDSTSLRWQMHRGISARHYARKTRQAPAG